MGASAGIPGFGEVRSETTVSVTAGGGGSSSSTKSKTEESNWNRGQTNSKSSSKTESVSEGSSDAYSVSNGKSNSKTNSHSSSSSEDNRASDSISLTKSYAQTLNKGKSEQKGTSESTGRSYNVNDQFTSDESTSVGSNLNEETSAQSTSNIETSNQTSFTVSVSSRQGYTVEPGGCKILVCFLFVVSAAVPYDCIDENKELKRVHTEMMLIDSSTMLEGNLTCAQSLIDCQDKKKANIFLNYNTEFIQALREANSFVHFDYGMEFYSNTSHDLVVMTSDNSWFQLVLFADGNLAVMRHQKVMWQTEMSFFADYTTRIRINEKGHLIQESRDLFINTHAQYRQGEWIQVWSSAPINHNVTIGIPFNEGNSYVLVLSDTGILHMYDSVGALIWCTDVDCQHRFGYKFPEVYLVPILSNQSDFSTPYEENNHNSISRSVKRATIYSDANSTIYLNEQLSMDMSCKGLDVNKAILSPNKRYAMYLEESGNLVVKDGTRTMWESVSAHIEFALAPYQLLLTPTGFLIIRSKNGYMVWTSVLKNEPYKSVYKLKLLDEGRLVIADKHEKIVWESWPFEDLSKGITFYRPVEYKYVLCDGKPLLNKRYLISTSSIGNTMNETSNLISKNGLWDLVILNRKQLVIRKLNVAKYSVFSSGFPFNKLVLNSNGSLELQSDSKTIWKLRFSNLTNSFVQNYLRLELDNKGMLFVNDGNNVTVWRLNEELIKYELTTKSIEMNHLKLGQYIVSNISKGKCFKMNFRNLTAFKGE